MVKKTLVYFAGSILFPMFCFAAEFTASVDRNQLGVGDQLTLQLKLSGASPKSGPDILGLQKDFTITSKQHSSSTTIINGKVSNSMSWQFGLVPKKEGAYIIPSIKVESSEGLLRSQPLTISVEKSSSPSLNDIDKGITLSAKVNKDSPYKNEPIVYTVQLVSQQDLVNIQFKDMSVEGAIVKAWGKPKVYEKFQNGVSVKVAEVNYIITPLKDGRLKVPELVIQGEKMVQDQNPIDSLLGHDTDPFRILQKLQNLQKFGMTQLEPFSVTSNAVTLDVKKPPQNLVPWLPAVSLKISETIAETQVLKVGEPFTRAFTIVGEGTTANQLPSLKDQQGHGDVFKVYEDKPVTEETLKNGKITSWREENYTLIPQQHGTLTLPEISIPWWNVKENKVEYAKVPERMVKVIASTTNIDTPPKIKSSVTPTTPAMTTTLEKTSSHTINTIEKANSILYAIITILAIILVFVIFFLIIIKNKFSKLKEKIHEIHFNDALEKKKFNNKSLNHKELSEVRSAEELQKFLQIHALQNWGAPQNASLERVFEAAKKQCSTLSQQDIDYIINSLHDAMYAEKYINIEDLKKRCMDLIQAVKNSDKEEENNSKKLPDLNPT